MSGEEGGDGDVFVEGFPVEAAAADAELVALRRCGAEEAGKPGERDAEGSSSLCNRPQPWWIDRVA